MSRSIIVHAPGVPVLCVAVSAASRHPSDDIAKRVPGSSTCFIFAMPPA
jgi:hypothetical protein